MPSTRRQFLQSSGAFAVLQLPVQTPVASAQSAVNAPEVCRIATVGHVDHGKTTLASAITKVLAEDGRAQFVPYDQLDKAPKRKFRGISMSIANVEYRTRKRTYSLTDCAGHADYVRALITGAFEIDGAILVVSAADGPMPQTREHIALAQQIGVPKLLVYLNKIDQVQNLKLLDLVHLEVRELLEKYGYSGDRRSSFIRGSALMALEGKSPEQGRESILKLVQAVDAEIPQPVPVREQSFLIAVEEVRSISGRSPVVEGRIERGTVKVGDEVDIVGLRPTRSAAILGVEMPRKPRDQAEAGEKVTVMLRDIKREDVKRGQVLCKSGSVKPYTRFKAEAYILTKEEGGRHTPLFANTRPQFFFRTNDVTGLMRLSAGTEMVMPGDNVTIEVHLTEPIALEKKQRFAIRENGRSIGAGVVTDLIE